MANESSGSRIELKLNFSVEFVDRLKTMKEISNAPTYSDVIRSALGTYEKVLPVIKDEEGFFIEKLDGTRTYIER